MAVAILHHEMNYDWNKKPHALLSRSANNPILIVLDIV